MIGQPAGRRPGLVNLIEAEARRRRKENAAVQALPARLEVG